MIDSRPARAAIAALPWPVPGVGRWVLRGGSFGLCVAAALCLTAVRLESTRLGYQLNELHKERAALTEAIARLGVELDTLSAAPRTVERARSLGFVYPPQGSVRVLDE